METLIIKFENGNKAVHKVLDGLKTLGAITIERPIYNEEFVAKVRRGDAEFAAGKGKAIKIEELWN